MSESPSEVTKIGTVLPISVELLLAHGAITEDQAREMGWTPPPPRPPIPLGRRLRSAVRSWWWEHKVHHLGPCDHDDCI